MRLIILLVLLGPTAVFAVTQFTTNGTSGPQCGRTRCLGSGQAACVDGECVCQGETSKGIGNFVCVREDEDFAVVFNDPMVRGFDGSHIKIALIGKFLAAHISTSTCTGGSPDNVTLIPGICDFRFFAWGLRKLGKTFVRGIECHILVWKGNTSYHHAARVESEAFDGQFTFSEDGNTYPFGAGQFEDPVITDIPDVGIIETIYDIENNFARIKAYPCGIEIGIRGIEKTGDSLAQPAGAYIKVLRACDPTYLSNDISVFSPPIGQGLSLIQQAEAVSVTIGSPVSPALVAMFKAFPGQHMQDFPNAPIEISMLADTIQDCDLGTLFQSLIYCLFLIENPRYFRCVDPTNDGRYAIRLLDECIFSICDRNQYMCLDVQVSVLESGCYLRLLPNQLSILNFPCESLDDQ